MADMVSALGAALVEDFPPSYAESTAATTPSLSSLSRLASSSLDAGSSPLSPGAGPSPSPPLSSLFSSPITTHLSTLPAQMRAAQQAHASSQVAQDLDVIDRLVPAISAFLADLNASSSVHGTPPLAELTLVPASAVPPAAGWALSDAAERRRQGEVVRVMRVQVDAPSSSSAKKSHLNPPDEKKSSGRGAGGDGNGGYGDDDDDDGAVRYSDSRADGFDDWGRFTDEADGGLDAGGGGAKGTYFRDESAARRLAAYLQPRQLVETDRRVIQQAVVEAKKDKAPGWRWGRKKSEAAPASAPAPAPAPAPAVHLDPLIPGGDSRVSVAVKAVEVTFRRENEWGIWETLTGFGIVVTVRVKKS